MKALPKILLGLTAVAAFSLAHPASVHAVPTTYQYTGKPFFLATAPYTTSNFVTAMITLAAPLGANFSGLVSPTAFTLSDGVQTITNLTSGVTSSFFFVTGPTGLITNWTISAAIPALGRSILSSTESRFGIDAARFGDGRGLGPGFGTWTVGSVPDTGSTLLLMTLTLMALGLVARRFKHNDLRRKLSC